MTTRRMLGEELLQLSLAGDSPERSIDAAFGHDQCERSVECFRVGGRGEDFTCFVELGLIDPQVMALPVVWLASPQSDGITGARFIAKFWDASLPPGEAAAKIRTRAAWPDLAEAASRARGFAT